MIYIDCKSRCKSKYHTISVENTEGVIKNGQSRGTGNIDEEKQNKNTTHYMLDITIHKQTHIA